MLLRSVVHPLAVDVMTATHLTCSLDKRAENKEFICQ